MPAVQKLARDTLLYNFVEPKTIISQANALLEELSHAVETESTKDISTNVNLLLKVLQPKKGMV